MPVNTEDLELLRYIPTELRTPALWVQYYLVPNPKRLDKKPDKHPCVGYASRANCRSLDYLLTNRTKTKHDGYQRVVEKGEGLVFIDLDHCRDAATGETEDWAQEIIDTFDTYTELSRSREGYHLVCKAILNDDFKVDRNPIEIYSAARIPNKLIAMTGDVIDGIHVVVENRQEQAAALLAKTKVASCPNKTTVSAIEMVTETEITDAGIEDMPEACLDGWLGAVCKEQMGGFPRAYAWLALLAAASVYVPRETPRCNLFVDLDGPLGSGKSSAFETSFRLFSLNFREQPNSPLLLEVKAGSAEGLTELIGDVNGAPRLFYPDELGHLLDKSMIERASFPRFLTTAFYKDNQLLTVAKRKQLPFNCRLTIAGGTVEDQFGDLFGSTTTGGLYDRFLFGKFPTGSQYLWRPLDDVKPVYVPTMEAAGIFQEDRVVPVRVHFSVWDECDHWKKELKMGREAELAIRAAIICASFDGRRELTAEMLGPAFAFAKYQTRLRLLLQPNPGQNPDAVMAFVIRNWMNEHASDGKWVGKRKLSRALHTTRKLGPGVFDRALKAMGCNGELEFDKAGKLPIIRLVPEVSPQNGCHMVTDNAIEVSPPRARDERLST